MIFYMILDDGKGNKGIWQLSWIWRKRMTGWNVTLLKQLYGSMDLRSNGFGELCSVLGQFRTLFLSMANLTVGLFLLEAFDKGILYLPLFLFYVRKLCRDF